MEGGNTQDIMDLIRPELLVQCECVCSDCRGEELINFDMIQLLSSPVTLPP